MPIIKFSFESTNDYSEPDHHIIPIQAEIFEYMDEEEDSVNNEGFKEELVGRAQLVWVQRANIMNDGISLFEAMDSHTSETCECFEELFDLDTEDWKPEVLNLYPDLSELDLLLIEKLELVQTWRGKGLGLQTVRQITRTLGPMVGLIVCKPFPLQYSGYKVTAGESYIEPLEHRKTRLLAEKKVKKFWKHAGFRQVTKSTFMTFSLEFDQLPTKIPPKQ